MSTKKPPEGMFKILDIEVIKNHYIPLFKPKALNVAFLNMKRSFLYTAIQVHWSQCIIEIDFTDFFTV